MVYVERNQAGEIIAIHSESSQADLDRPSHGELERKGLLDPEVVEFFYKSGDRQSFDKLLSLLDQGVIRVLDDLIELLIKKNIILATELPVEAQLKINERKRVRKKLSDQQLTVDDII